MYPVIEMFISPESVQYFNYRDNSKEKEFINLVLDEIYKLSGVVSKPQLDSIFSNPIKKKFITFNFAEHPYLEPTGTNNHSIQTADENQLLNEIGEELLATGVWNVGVISNQYRNKFSNKVVEILYKKLQQEVSEWSPVNLIELIYNDLEITLFKLMLIQKNYAEEIACYPEKENEILLKINENNQTSIALKFLIEYVSACPPKGSKTIGVNQYERVLAICFLIIDWAYKNDLFYYNIFNTPIEILKSHRIGMKHTEFENMFNINEAIRKEQLTASSNPTKIHTLNSRKDFLEEINSAFTVEFGYSLFQLYQFINGLSEYSKSQNGNTVYSAKISEIIYYFHKNNSTLDKETIQTIIDSISLTKRNSFLKPSKPFRTEAVYPWRFNRALSFTRRPIIIRDDELLWGNRQLSHMFQYMLDLIDTGKFKSHSKEMNSLVGKICKNRGREFNDLVYKALKNLNAFEVHPNISKINGIHIAQNKLSLGDIDVLIIDKQYHKIIAAEVKNFNLSRNPYEMHLEYQNIFEGGIHKQGYYAKHCRRVDWCNQHLSDLQKEYKLEGEDWETIGLFILSHPLSSIGVYHKEVKALTINNLTIDSIRSIY